MSDQDVRDRLEITSQLYRYALAIDRKDFELLAAVFTPDATIDYNVDRGTKLKFGEMRDWLREALQMFYVTHHVMSNPMVELSGDTARSVTYLTATHVQATPEGEKGVVVLHGVYTDLHVRTAVGWRIHERVLDQVHVDGEFLDIDRVQRFPEAPRR